MSMCMLDTIRSKREELYAMAKRFNAEALFVFGSCARKEDSSCSDIDFLVHFSPEAKFGDPVGLSDAFNAYFDRRVDVVSAQGLSPYIGKRILREAVAV